MEMRIEGRRHSSSRYPGRRFVRRMLATPRRRGALACVVIVGAAMGFAAASQKGPQDVLASKTSAEIAASPAPTFIAQH